MPIRVETPAGIAEFPDGTAPTEIEAALAAQFGEAAAEPAAPTRRPFNMPDPREGESNADYAMRVGEQTWGEPVLPGLTRVGEATGAVSNALKNAAQKLYQSVLKPKDATVQQFPGVVQNLLADRRIIGQGARGRVVGTMRQVGNDKSAVLSAADAAGRTIPRETLRAGLDDALEASIAKSEAPVKDLGKLAKMERDLLPDEANLSPSRVDAIKSKLQSESERLYRGMRMGNKVNETGAKAKLAVAGRAKTAVEDATRGFTTKDGKGIVDLNQRYGNLKGQAAALRDAVKRESNTHVIGMRDLIGVGAGTALAGVPGGAGGALLMRLLTHPKSGSAIAIGLNEAAQQRPDDALMAIVRLMAGTDQEP